MKNKKYYYDVADDLANGCWANFIIGGRNTGKTYSSLKYCIDNDITFGFIKRTNLDVEMLCSNNDNVNFSPFNAINRDTGSSIYPVKLLKDRIGGFFPFKDGERAEHPVGYILSLNALKDIKGFEFPERMDVLIFDEFIPQPWEKVNRREGEQLMDLYRTIARDREHRGYGTLKLICLANAVRLANPINNFFEITDTFAEMQMQGRDLTINQERRMLMHLLHNSEKFDETEHDSEVYKAMHATQWGAMAYGNTFGYDDVSNVSRISIKGFHPVVNLHYKNQDYYIYMKDGIYQVCSSQNKQAKTYNLNRENEQKAFFYDYLLDLREACIADKMHFETYSMYDLIINYKKIFVL